MNRISAGLLVAAIAVSTALVGGCARTNPDAVTVDGTATQGRLTAVSWLYMLHVDLKRRAPANFEELRLFAEKLPASHGGPSSLSEEFLISPRDRKPIVIRYGLRLPPGTIGSEGAKIPDGPVLAHEQEGVKGRRFVVFAGSSRVEQVDEARFKELVR